MQKLRIETIKLDDLTPHPRNPRDGDVGAISESLTEYGQYAPIVVQKSTGHIIAGNHRFKAARALGWADIQAVRIDVDDDTALRILLADNRLSDIATNDDPVLVELLSELAVTGVMPVGYDGDDLDDLIRRVEGFGPAADPEKEWTGMPEYDAANLGSVFHVTVHFRTEDDADRFFLALDCGRPSNKSMWWPESDGHVGSSMRHRVVSE